MATPLSIVLIDDDTLVHKLVGRVLRGVPCEFVAFADTFECLRHLQQHCPDHLWIDMRMPGCDGLSFLRQFREQCPDASSHVVLCSSVQITDVARDEALQLGAQVKLKDELLDSGRLRNLLDADAGAS